jgi:transposase InsO family protein
MAANGIVANDQSGKKVPTTIPDAAAAALVDLVGRDLTVAGPGRRTCEDITTIPTAEGWCCLASVLDPASRRLITFVIGEHPPSGR